MMVSDDAAFMKRAIALLAVSYLVPTVAATAGTLRGNGGGGSLLQRQRNEAGDGGAFDDSPQVSCSCDCCDVVRRLPDEVSDGASVKCSPSHQHSEDMCAPQCSTDKDDQVLQDEIVDMDRFCFFECKPAAGRAAPEKSQCVAFSSQEAAKTIDGAGNPMDPAFLYGPVRMDQAPASFYRNGPPPGSFHNGVYTLPAAAASLLSKGLRSGQAPPEPDSVDDKKAKTMAIKGKALSKGEGADAQKEAARLREMENQKMQTLHKALKQAGNGVVTLDPFAAIQDLTSASKNARVQAEQAAVIAAKAVKAYDGGRQKIWKLALSEAGKEVLRWKAHAEKLAKDNWDAMHKPTWQGEAIKEAQKASKPYIEGLLRAQESVKLYNEKGFAMSNKASALWKEAQDDAAKANKLPRGTIAQDNVAKSDMLDARSKAKEAQQMALEARQYFATAADVRKGIPVYQWNAQKAAQQAVMNFKFDPDR